MSLVSDLDLPAFDYITPDFSADRYHQQLAGTRRPGWLAKSPLAYIVLAHDCGEFFLRSRATVFPGGPLAEHIDTSVLGANGPLQPGGVEGIYGIDKLPIIWSGSSKPEPEPKLMPEPKLNHGPGPHVS